MSILKKYNIEPIENHLVLKRDVVDEKTEGGLFIPGTSIGDSNVAKVLAVGPGLNGTDGKRIPMQIKVGDIVIIDKFSGQTLEIEGEKILIARETSIVAIIYPK